MDNVHGLMTGLFACISLSALSMTYCITNNETVPNKVVYHIHAFLYMTSNMIVKTLSFAKQINCSNTYRLSTIYINK